MEKPIAVKPIPDQVVNEDAMYEPFDFKDYIQAPDGSSLQFSAEQENGRPLPSGVTMSSEGLMSGMLERRTRGKYIIVVTAKNEAGEVHVSFSLTVNASLTNPERDTFDILKSQAWEALGNQLSLPDLSTLYNRPIDAFDLYYLYERWGLVKVWDAYNLEPEGELIPLNLEGTSKHFAVYDRGSCLVACPKDLFSYERTLSDGLITAKALAQEVYKRQWTIQLAGFEKYTRAVWVELQHLGDQYGNQLEIINYNPNQEDLNLYTIQANEIRIKALSS
jgi:hypothetical protein